MTDEEILHAGRDEKQPGKRLIKEKRERKTPAGAGAENYREERMRTALAMDSVSSRNSEWDRSSICAMI